MSQGVLFDKDNQAVLLYSSDRNSWEDKTDSVTEIQLAYYYGNTSGYVIE